ncbi:MAG: alpha/beta fold hydrolase [Actinomycetota bacterium]
MRTDRWTAALAIGAAVVAAACGPTRTIEVERSMASEGRVDVDAGPRVPDASVSGTPSAPVDRPDGDMLTWGACDDFGIPDPDETGSRRWECARLDVAMDPSDPGAELAPVSLALTRHLATGDRIGTLLMNPGGPGGAGLPLAWGLRPQLPAELLRGFDVVAWDPRGVGQSRPAARCPAGVVPGDVGYIASCVDATGPLAEFLAAPYSVADMESIRSALGESTLDFLGYSYGSILGALYADRFPDRVGAFVLDGVTDPDVGSTDGPFDDGFATFADDGLPAALERFHELCAATDRCLGGPGVEGDDVEIAIETIVDGAALLPTDHFDGGPDALTSTMVDEHLAWAMGSAADWELLAAALVDARDGDGSTLAAHIGASGLVTSDDVDDLNESGDEDPGDGAQDNFAEANFLIYCADLGPLIEEWSFCDGMPVAAEPLTPIGPVDVRHPILVIGTEFDPLTPGHHAPDFAERLDDAVWIRWNGVGHTAFPGWTRCLDDVVVAHLLGDGPSASGTECPFAEGVDDEVSLAEDLFGFGVADGRPWLGSVLESNERLDAGGLDCVVAALVPTEQVGPPVDDGVVAALILDVRTPEADDALDAAVAAC